ncbi:MULTISPECIES: response regulator transcription factor [Anaerotruncus]|jgi:two component transcriptional regulator, winged helix family|uniref:Heme response regulator HssR n=3 Tax=Anaerotruncus TaxID=244127 RepID=A0A498CP51_9FIRM|nr:MULTISPECIES: response regulator transcription factor [Anaerotruncus]MBC3939188.1 response regulator transcription factor [Anaerotruncus massiliensis (ex Togo et al. 2019)]MCQ4897458.1 response regulator transcription factor [Anaerotruncus sp. DFI.9.16]RLL09760.1 DNA-binding response regulator [Anaerotruncus massiliensis (ex Liu et al. 2021)]GKH48758.1 DNA-binding response regulator [Oscillospiraceae bacterium]
MATILIVDDDRKICRLEDIYLRSEGFDTLVARDGFEALSIIGQKRVDLIVADILMPNLDGQGLLRALREHYIATPVLMMTSKSAFEDKKRLFECGADDYMVKPVDLEELVLRIRAILRRYNISNARQLRIGDTILDYSSLEVRAPGGTLTLPQKEFYLLFLLLSYPGRIFTRQELMDELWGTDTNTSPRTVDVHINRLRSRFAGREDFEISTIRGLGYKGVIKAAVR